MVTAAKFKPLQAAGSFVGVPNTPSFTRIIEVQDGIPLDGAKASLRTYSPFLIRVVLPSILNGDSNTVLSTGENPRRVPPSGTVRKDNRNDTTYSRAQQDTRVDPSGLAAFDRMVVQGGVVDGITRASQQSLEDAYNQAIFQQLFSPTVRNINQTPTSQRTNTVTPALTNDTSSLSLALQLKQLASIPPLLMLINPSSMRTEYTKVAQFQNRNRKGYLYEVWGEEMTKISFTFHIGAYTAGRAFPTQQGVVSGVQRASRNDSAAFQQLMSLLALYQGGTYLQDMEGRTRAFPMVGNLAIEYDQMVYVGHMEGFSFGEEDTKQHGGLEISIEFVANKVFDVAGKVGQVMPMQSPSNPQGTSRGNGLVRGSGGTSVSFFSTPNVGGTSSLAETTNQAWDRAVGAAGATSLQTGTTTSVNDSGVLSSRRR